MTSTSCYEQLHAALLNHPDYFAVPAPERPACTAFAVLAGGLQRTPASDPAEVEAAYLKALDEARILVASGKLSGLVLPAPERTEAVLPAPSTATTPDEPAVTEASFPDYPPHPVASMFPMMSAPELVVLAADIKDKEKLDEPIVLFENSVVDGRNRQAACKLAGIPPRYVEWDGEGSLVSFVLSRNLHRRHLTDQQRAIVAARAKDAFEAEARERSLSNLANHKAPLDGLDPARRDAGRSAEKAAALLGVSVDATKKAAKVLKTGAPELVTAMQQQTVSIDAASAVTTLPQQQQRKLLAKGKVKQAARQMRQAKKKVEREAQAAVTKPDDPGSSVEASDPAPPPPPSPSVPSAPVSSSPTAITIPIKDALRVVLRAVKHHGPALARKVIDRIAGEVGLEVWVASGTDDDDLPDLAGLLRSKLDTVAAKDLEHARSWVDSHAEALYEIISAATPVDIEEPEDDG